MILSDIHDADGDCSPEFGEDEAEGPWDADVEAQFDEMVDEWLGLDRR